MLREVLAHFGFTFDRGQLAAAGKAVDGVKSKVQSTGRGLADVATGLRAAFAGFVANEIAHVTSAIAEQAASLADLSEQTSLSTDDLQAWTLAANLGGASAQDFTAGLRKLSKELATGVDESGQQSKLFRNLGIETKDSAGKVRELSDVLPEIAEKFKGLQSGAEKSALAQQIFGRAGSKLVPLLSQGAEGVAKLREQFEALGGGFSKEAIANADEYDDALVKLNFSFFGLKSLLATQVFPALSRVVETLTHASVSASKWLKETTALGTGVKILAALLAGKLALALAPYLLPGLKFLAIFLAIDDLLAFLEGKDSIIGDLLNRAFGHGTAPAVRAWCADAIASMRTFFDELRDGTAIASGSALGNVQTFIIDAGNGFKLLRSQIASVTASIVFLFQNAVLQMQTSWNDFVGSLKLPPALASALKIDTSGQVVNRTNALVDASVKKEQAAGIGRQYVSDARRALTGREGPTVRAPLPGAAGSSVAVTNNNTPVNVVVNAPGASPKDFKVIKQAVTDGVNSGLASMRAALQAVEQRAP